MSFWWSGANPSMGFHCLCLLLRAVWNKRAPKRGLGVASRQLKSRKASGDTIASKDLRQQAAGFACSYNFEPWWGRSRPRFGLIRRGWGVSLPEIAQYVRGSWGEARCSKGEWNNTSFAAWLLQQIPMLLGGHITPWDISRDFEHRVLKNSLPTNKTYPLSRRGCLQEDSWPLRDLPLARLGVKKIRARGEIGSSQYSTSWVGITWING